MILWIFVLILLATLVSPRLRASEKKSLHLTFLATGGMALILGIFTALYLFPKIQNLQVDSQIPLASPYLSTGSFFYSAATLLMIIIGLSYRKKENTSDKFFYCMFLLYFVLLYIIMGFYISAIVQPVYELTKQL